MFKNKTIQMKLVPDQTTTDVAPRPPVTPEDVAYHATNIVETATTCAIATIGCYMIADTLRKIVIHTAATKIT